MHSYITTSQSAQYYECGFSCDNAIVLVDGDSKYFLTDSRYTTEAKEKINNALIVESDDFVSSLKDISKNIKTLEFDGLEVSFQMYKNLSSALPFTTLVSSPNFHQKLRIIKTQDEIDLIRESQRLNKEAFSNFAKHIKENLSEASLQYRAKNFLSFDGEYTLSFEPIFAINGNGAKPHALPSKTDILKNEDLVLFDAGIKYKRYCSDMTRTANFEGSLEFDKKQKFKNGHFQKIYDIVLYAQEFTIKNIKAGMKASEVDNLARSKIEESGYGKFFVHSTGHGIGLDIHELPRISKKDDTIIQDGMVFSIEPGIYLPDELGVRIEDLVVIENGRARVL